MSNNKDFKVKNGIQPTSYFEGVGTVVSGSVGYNLAGASYDSVSFSVASQGGTPRDAVFNNDGTKMYMLEQGSKGIYQYSLSTAFDVSTASYDSVSLTISGQELQPLGMAFNSDGTKMYATGYDSDSVHQYSLSTAFDLSTASYDSVSFSVASQENTPYSIAFNSDGTKMYIVGSSSDSVHQYSLSTAFNVSTASYDSVSFSVASQETIPYSIVFNNDGTKLYMMGLGNTIYQYSLSTGFDVSTASYDSVSFSVASQDSSSASITFNSDGTKLYMIGFGTDTIYQYSTVLATASLDLSTGSVFEVTPTSDTQVSLSNPADSGTVSSATLITHGNIVKSYDIANASYRSVIELGTLETSPRSIKFKPDGTKMYIIGSSGDGVYEYSLSVPWEMTSGTYIQTFSVLPQEGFPRDVFFKPDGTRMFVMGGFGDDVNEYSLSTAWDVSTASYVRNFSVATEDGSPTALWFKSDGLKMIMLGLGTDTLYQYTLSTAWNISTASYDSVSFSVSSEATAPEGMYITNDGSKMYIANSGSSDAVYEYSFSTAGDISTLTYTNKSFSDIPELGNTVPTLNDVTLSDDGTKMYLVDDSENAIMQFDIGRTANVFYDNSISFSGDMPPVSPNNEDTDIITFFTKDGGTSYNALQVINGAS